jgi:hypothetical protein
MVGYRSNSTLHDWLIEVIRFFDDIELLRQRWQSQNTETVAELYVKSLIICNTQALPVM